MGLRSRRVDAGWAADGCHGALCDAAGREAGAGSMRRASGRSCRWLEAAEAAYSADGHTLFFTRWDWQGSETKRYKGGSAENMWRFDGQGEAVPLTADYEGTSAHPMFWNERVYFLSDRDGVMNVYSMDADGKGVKQESHQKIFDVRIGFGGRTDRSCMRAGADLWMLDLKTGQEAVIPITLDSDFDQMREHWVKKPLGLSDGGAYCAGWIGALCLRRAARCSRCRCRRAAL